MILLRAAATRWVAGDPPPGVVRIEFVDADGRRRRFDEKATVVDATGLLNPRARYPVPIQLACLPRRRRYRPGEQRTVNLVDLTPWSIGDDTLLPVERDQLSWAAPALYSDLSVAARQAVALVTFRRWRAAVGLTCPELSTLEDHLWQYATLAPGTFDDWYEAHPLTQLTSRDPLPDDVRDSIAVNGLDEDEVRSAIGNLIDITYGGLFGGIFSEWSLGELEAMGRITAGHGTPLVPADGFVDSLWIDDDWGRPGPDLVERWRDS